jgi:hypothetical protein
MTAGTGGENSRYTNQNSPLQNPLHERSPIVADLAQSVGLKPDLQLSVERKDLW